MSLQMRALLANSPSGVHDCLQRMQGTVAARNSCRGPWSQSLNLSWTPPVYKRILGRPISANVYFQNPLSGLDLLLHGSSGLRGWGTQPIPDQTLPVPRGFDAQAHAFRYDVNPRFGDTRAFRSINRSPFRIAIDVSVDFSVPFDVQSLRRALEPVRMNGVWARRSADSTASYYMRQRASDLYRHILAESDSLLLTREQIDRLQSADTSYVRRVRELYRPLGEFLTRQPDKSAGKAALDTVKATADLQQALFWESVDTVATILNAGQREMLPFVKGMFAVPLDQRKTSSFGFSPRVELFDKPTVRR